MADSDFLSQSLDPNSALAQALMKARGFINPAYATPELRAKLRDQAAVLQKPGEAKSWAQVFGNMAQAGVGQLLANRAEDIEQAGGASANKAMAFGEPGNAAQGGVPAQGGGIPSPSGAGGGAGADPHGLVSSYASSLGQAGAAGLVGGFGHETAGTFSPAIQGDNNSSIGYAQWHDTSPGQGRKSNLSAYARKYGKSPTDPDIQRQYPLVEMGLAGSPSDPGFSTERKAGQALQAARTPQEATAAALMYERPKGWSPAHPERASGYASRLAYASALMGGAGGGGGGGGATAYADAGGSQGGGGPQWPAQRPQTQVPLSGGGLPQPNHPSTIGGQPLPQRPTGPMMAQNVPGGSPIQGSQAYADFMTHNFVPQAAKENVLRQQLPAAVTGPFGEVVISRPNTTQTGTEVMQGGVQLPTTVGPGGITTTTPFRLPPGGQSAGQSAQPLTPPADAKKLEDLAKSAGPAQSILQGKAAEGARLEADTARMGQYAKEGSDADAKLGQIEAMRALGKGLKSGISAQVKAFLVDRGFQVDDEAGRLQTYRLMASSLLPPDASQGLREHVPILTPDEANKNTIADYLESQWKHMKRRGMIAVNDHLGNASEKQRLIQALPLPQSYGAPEQPAGAPSTPAPGGAATAGGGSAALPKVGDIVDGYKYKGGPPHSPSSWVKASP